MTATNHNRNRRPTALLALLGLVMTAVPAGAVVVRYDVKLIDAGPNEGTQALALNDHAQVTGETTLGNDDTDIFFWEPGGVVQNVDTIGFDFSEGLAINNLGQVAGHGIDCPPVSGACWSTVIRYTPGVGLEDLGALYGVDGHVVDINIHGDIAGKWWDADGSSGSHSFLITDDQGLIDLGLMGGWSATALSLNDNREIVGSILTAPGRRAFKWSDGAMQDLGTLGGADAQAYYVAQTGAIAGWAEDSDDRRTPFVQAPGGSMQAIPTPPGADWAEAWWVTSTGVVVGSWAVADPFEERLFYYSPQLGALDIGVLPDGLTGWAQLEAVNEAGEAIFTGVDDTTYEQVPAYYSPQTGLVNLNDFLPDTLDLELRVAADLNKRGQIVAYGSDSNWRQLSVLLTPIVAGDLNCDGDVSFGDINPFVEALIDPAGFDARYPNCPRMNADVNADEVVDFADINPFVDLLTE